MFRQTLHHIRFLPARLLPTVSQAFAAEAVAIAAKANIDENILFDLISNHAMNSQLIQLVSTDSICYSF